MQTDIFWIQSNRIHDIPKCVNHPKSGRWKVARFQCVLLMYREETKKWIKGFLKNTHTHTCSQWNLVNEIQKKQQHSNWLWHPCFRGQSLLDMHWKQNLLHTERHTDRHFLNTVKSYWEHRKICKGDSSIRDVIYVVCGYMLHSIIYIIFVSLKCIVKCLTTIS